MWIRNRFFMQICILIKKTRTCNTGPQTSTAKIVSLHNSRMSLRGSIFKLLCGSGFPRKCLSMRLRICIRKEICKINEKMGLFSSCRGRSCPYVPYLRWCCNTPSPPPILLTTWQRSSRLSFSSRRTRPHWAACSFSALVLSNPSPPPFC